MEGQVRFLSRKYNSFMDFNPYFGHFTSVRNRLGKSVEIANFREEGSVFVKIYFIVIKLYDFWLSNGIFYSTTHFLKFAVIKPQSPPSLALPDCRYM
jgi:hypothetical protein